MTDRQDTSIRELVAELATVEDRLRELGDASGCREGRSWTAAETLRLSRRREQIRRSLQDWRGNPGQDGLTRPPARRVSGS